MSVDGQKTYDAHDLLASIVDADSIDEYKADYGKTLVTTYARIGGHSVGIVASQRLQVRTKKEGIQMGGVIYHDSADKAARFIMDCNQTGLPIIFSRMSPASWLAATRNKVESSGAGRNW